MLRVSIFLRRGVPKDYILLLPDEGLVESRFPKFRENVSLSSLRTKLVHFLVLHNCGETSVSVGKSDTPNFIKCIRDNRNVQLAWLYYLLLTYLLHGAESFLRS